MASREAVKREATSRFGEAQETTVARRGARNLTFTGWLIGSGVQGTPGAHAARWRRGVTVRVYLTLGGHYVAAAIRWTTGAAASVCTAAACATPEELLAWLTADGGGKLGRASKAAWDQACHAWPPLASSCEEHID